MRGEQTTNRSEANVANKPYTAQYMLQLHSGCGYGNELAETKNSGSYRRVARSAWRGMGANERG